MKKKLLIALTAATLLASFPLTVYAGEWQQDSTGFWYLNDDGTKPVDTWKLIDNNWYYFKSNGYMNTGWINVSGQWYYCEPTGQMRTTELPFNSMLMAPVVTFTKIQPLPHRQDGQTTGLLLCPPLPTP